MKVRLDTPLVLLTVSIFLAPLIGGQVSLDASGFPSPLAILLGGAETPLLTHAFLTLPIVFAFALLLRRQVVQVPNATMATTLLLFFGLLAATGLLSAFRLTSIATTAEWLAYALAFLTAVGATGRKLGPLTIATASFAGCVLLAMRGLLEYGEMKAIDPTWRIFAGWVNPNATAAMLLVGFFLGLAVLALAKDRLAVLMSGLGVALIGLGIVLTQSKGALLVLFVALLVFGLAVLSTGKSEARGTTVKRTLSAVAVLALLAFAIQMRSAPPAGTGGTTSGISRVTQAGATSEQSAGFRTLLWKGALAMARKNPAGYGIGTYRFESGRSGLHTQTFYTHNAFLQLATEGSFVLPLLFFIAGGLWIRLAFRGWSKLPADRRILQAGVFSAVSAVVGHSLIDSDLYYFGVGLTFFVLLGVGLLLSADAVAPEFAPKPVRGIGTVGGFAVVFVLLYVGVAEFQRAEARGRISMRDAQGAAAALASARSMVPFDGEAWYLTAQIAPTDSERREAAERAASLAPTTRNIRLFARQLAAENRIPEAITQLQFALVRDPNNLPTLAQLAEFQGLVGNVQETEATLKRLVAVEQTSYFKIRSLPELVPTETYLARIQLARNATGKAKVDLLQPAIDGFSEYLAKTIPMVKRMAAADPPSDFGGENRAKAEEKLARAAEGARELAAAYRALGDPRLAEAAESAAAGFTGAFEDK
ncbi:MAG: O-antigen ligase family protein [Fimbriimonas sp.]